MKHKRGLVMKQQSILIVDDDRDIVQFIAMYLKQEGLPLCFRDIDGPSMPKGGVHIKDDIEVPAGDVVSPTGT